jgi:transcriptional regulator with XRE-family HTH domain
VKALGKRVKARRTLLGMTQAELAGKVGRTHGWLSGIENGTGGETPAEVLSALAIELGDDPADYLRLAGRAVLTAEDVIPVPPIDPRISAAIEGAVERSMERLGDRLETLLRELLPGVAQ